MPAKLAPLVPRCSRSPDPLRNGSRQGSHPHLERMAPRELIRQGSEHSRCPSSQGCRADVGEGGIDQRLRDGSRARAGIAAVECGAACGRAVEEQCQLLTEGFRVCGSGLSCDVREAAGELPLVRRGQLVGGVCPGSGTSTLAFKNGHPRNGAAVLGSSQSKTARSCPRGLRVGADDGRGTGRRSSTRDCRYAPTSPSLLGKCV